MVAKSPDVKASVSCIQACREVNIHSPAQVRPNEAQKTGKKIVSFSMAIQGGSGFGRILGNTSFPPFPIRPLWENVKLPQARSARNLSNRERRLIFRKLQHLIFKGKHQKEKKRTTTPTQFLHI